MEYQDLSLLMWSMEKTLNKNQFMMNVLSVWLSQYWKVTMEQCSLMGKQDAERLTL